MNHPIFLEGGPGRNHPISLDGRARKEPSNLRVPLLNGKFCQKLAFYIANEPLAIFFPRESL